jgi:hypothetical protein
VGEGEQAADRVSSPRAWLRAAAGLLAGLLIGAILFHKAGAPKNKLTVRLLSETNWAEYPVALFEVKHEGIGSVSLYYNLTEQRTGDVWPPPTPYGFNFLHAIDRDGESMHRIIVLNGETSAVVKVFQPETKKPWRSVMLHVGSTRVWPTNSTRQKLALYFNQHNQPKLGRLLNEPQPVEVIYGPELKPRDKLPFIPARSEK